jgi:hypothetical protein
VLRQLPAGLDVIPESNVFSRPLPQFFKPIADHFAKRSVHLEKALIERQDRHPDRRPLKKLAKNRVAKGQFHPAVDDVFQL